MNIEKFIHRGMEEVALKIRYLLFRIKALVVALYVLCFLSIGLLGGMEITGHRNLPIFFILTGIGFLALAICFHFIILPYKRIQKACILLTEGYGVERLLNQNLYISPLMDKVMEILSKEMDTTKRLNIAKEQAQYLALQNQINPHFLYNTLEGIRGEAKVKGAENIAEMTEALATFFRYTISNLDHLVSVEDELANIESYYTIQQFRFGDRLSLKIEYEQEDGYRILNLKIPKLILQPIVENSIYHGIEKKNGKGNLVIRMDCTEKYLIILISDDGVGISKSKLEDLNERLMNISTKDMDTKKGGIAIMNVNNRIKLLFGEEYGIVIYSTPMLGTDVEITLPIVEN